MRAFLISIMQNMQKFITFTEKLSNFLGWLTAIVLILMMLNVGYDAISRYLFNTNSVALQELEWHLFSVIILLGLSYTLNEDAHVRVDILFVNWSKKTQLVIDMVGVFLFILPLAILVFYGSFDFVAESYKLMEQSGDPGGLPYRFIIKGLIPLAFLMLIITSFGYFARSLQRYIELSKEAQS